MGCDIHIAFEIEREAGWELLLPAKIDDLYDYIDAKIADGTAHTVTGTPDDDEALLRFKAHLKAIPPDELLERIGLHENVRLYFGCPEDLRWRDYRFFASLAGVRSYNSGDQIWEPRGLPDGLTPYLKKEIEYFDCDYHSHSWQMLSELLSEPRLEERHPQKVAMLRDIAKMGDPEKIRMVYCFDN